MLFTIPNTLFTLIFMIIKAFRVYCAPYFILITISSSWRLGFVFYESLGFWSAGGGEGGEDEGGALVVEGGVESRVGVELGRGWFEKLLVGVAVFF